MYALQCDRLAELEHLSQNGLIDLYYGDETHFCSEGYVPYGWQFPGEDVYVPSEKGFRPNVFGLVARDNRPVWATTQKSINSVFVMGQLEALSFKVTKPTVVVLDNASVHRAKCIKERIPFWEQRGLYIFYLPTCSPELNIAETLWRKMKKEQIDPQDYDTHDSLAYAVNRCLVGFGLIWNIDFCIFNRSYSYPI